MNRNAGENALGAYTVMVGKKLEYFSASLNL